MAGAGTKLFVDGDILTAAQVNTYLQDQVIMRFANAASRDAAFGGVGEPVLAEGMSCYLDDTNTLQSYNGSAWVNVVSSTYPPALQLVKVQSFSGATNVDVTSCFSSEFTNYRAIVRIKGAGTSASYIRFLVGSTVQTDNLYSISYGVRYSIGTMGVSTRGDQYSLYGGVAATYFSNYEMEFYSPQVASYTSFTARGVFQYTATDHDAVNIHTRNAVTTQIDGFQITAAGGTSIDGTVTVYGYKTS